MRDYIHVWHIAPGLTKQNRHDTPDGWKQGLGEGQSTQQPNRNTTVRPNRKTEFEYDEDSEITDTADEWLLAGDWSNETWQDADERQDRIAQIMCDYLGIPEQQQPAIKATMYATGVTHSEMLVVVAGWET